VSLQDLKPNPQDTSTFYLAGIYQLLANSNITHVSIPPTLAQPPVFSAPRYAVWVNSLWFSSLFVGLTSAVMATSQQEWARRYITIVRYPLCSPEKRARMRALLVNGPHKSDLLVGGDGLMVYVHLAIFLFVAGAIIYLHHINHTVFVVGLFCIGYFAVMYLYFTLTPIFCPEFIICTPLSSIVLCLSLYISRVVIGVFSCTRRFHRLRNDIKRRCHEELWRGKWRAINETASEPSSKFDILVLDEIFLSLDEDSALDKFIDAIPGFCNSPLVNAGFPPPVQEKLQRALDGSLDQTFSFASMSGSVGSYRLISCLNAAHAALPPNVTLRILDDIFKGRWTEVLQSVEIGHSLRRWRLLKDNLINLKVQRITACIIACARRRDESWIMLVEDGFGIQGCVLRDYIARGNSPLLAILTHVIRRSLVGGQRLQQEILRSLSEFDIIDTLPGLQHSFCAMWNELVQEARNRTDPSLPIEILREIRHLYISLHEGTDSDAVPIDEPAFNLYPFCNIVGHRRYLTASTHTGGFSPSTNKPEIPSWRIQLGDSLDPSSPQRFVPVNVPSHPASLHAQHLLATLQNITCPANIHLFSTTTNRIDHSTPSSNIVSQQYEYVNLMPEHPSFPDLMIIPSATPMLRFPSPSPSPTTHLPYIPSQVAPTAYPSMPVPNDPGTFLYPNPMATPIRVTTRSDLPSSPISNPAYSQLSASYK